VGVAGKSWEGGQGRDREAIEAIKTRGIGPKTRALGLRSLILIASKAEEIDNSQVLLRLKKRDIGACRRSRAEGGGWRGSFGEPSAPESPQSGRK